MSSACSECPIAHTLGPMRRTALTIAALAALAACSGGSDDPPVAVRDVTGVTDPVVDTTPDVTAVPEPLDYVIEWTQVSERTDEGTLTVPLDYGDPQGDTIELYVARHRATAEPSAGSMLANRGGPGADGATLALDATGWFGSEITDNFDVIGWDPRGTGQSEGVVDCIDDADYDRYFSAPDITPDDDAERTELIELAQEYTEACIERVDTLQYVGTNNSGTRHGRDPPGARSRAGLVLRVQLRQ